jgi:large subunit ribosomal protein L15
MQLNTLKPKHDAKNKRPRVGRGGKRGTTAGKGTKGQKSRSGHRIRPAIRDLIQRLPKLRGYANKPVTPESTVISLAEIAALKSTVVTLQALADAKLIKSASSPAKILADGEITKAVTVQGVAVSAAAKAKIEKAGGSVI